MTWLDGVNRFVTRQPAAADPVQCWQDLDQCQQHAEQGACQDESDSDQTPVYSSASRNAWYAIIGREVGLRRKGPYELTSAIPGY
ncbi:hypothetical protein BRD19_12425 [Halobacteriales archaeon SW_7_65_23]|nr:MAG: hypothetical protein BRD19_12425 [Halobacteriales archaeon SW_7_65_23]